MLCMISLWFCFFGFIEVGNYPIVLTVSFTFWSLASLRPTKLYFQEFRRALTADSSGRTLLILFAEIFEVKKYLRTANANCKIFRYYYVEIITL